MKTPQKRIGCAVRAVCTPSMCSDNSLYATSTPGALRDPAVSCQSELRLSAVAKRHYRRWCAVTSERYGKSEIIRYIF